MKMRVSDYIARHLEKIGVRKVFLLSGGGMMHLVDAAGRQERLNYICNHHEHACAVAAQGYARQSGSLGVCFATSGPGATNTVTGIVECWQDSAPVLFITGQSKLSQTIRGSKLFGLRQFGTFEVDIVPIVESITKYSVFLDDPKKIRYHLEKAIYLATSGRPGPVLIDIPVDLQGALIEPELLEGFEASTTERSSVSDSVLNDILERLRTASKPLILAGHGIRCSGRAEQFLSLVERLNVPVVTTQLASDLIEYQHPLYVGHPGMKGDRPGNFAVQSADLILSLGSSLHVLTTGYELDRFAPQAYKIQVESDPFILKREAVGVHQKVQMSIEEFLDRVTDQTSASLGQSGTWTKASEWHERCQLWKRELSVRNEPHKRNDRTINYYDLIDQLSDQAKGTETIVADAGSAFYVVGQAFQIKRGQRVIISGALGAMGHALPLAIGASSVNPDKKVLCVVGEGSLQTNLQELATMRYMQANIALVVVNNSGYVSIRNTQNNFFEGHHVGTDEKSGLFFPSLEKLAEAYQIPFLKVNQTSQLPSAVEKIFQAKGPILLEVIAPYEQEIIPTVSSFKRPDGKMESKPLYDMSPFMDESRLNHYLFKDKKD